MPVHVMQMSASNRDRFDLGCGEAKHLLKMVKRRGKFWLPGCLVSRQFCNPRCLLMLRLFGGVIGRSINSGIHC